MHKKLLKLLTTKCKDMGLTQLAIGDLATMGSEGLTDESSDEDIENKADSLVPLAKLMQGEITRKTSGKKFEQSIKKEEGEDGDNGSDKTEPAWFTTYKKGNDQRFLDLETENTTLKNEKAVEARGASISAKAKELSIPEWRMVGVVVPDTADITTFLTEIKQGLVTNKLMSVDEALEKGDLKQIAKDDAKSWANGLPNN